MVRHFSAILMLALLLGCSSQKPIQAPAPSPSPLAVQKPAVDEELPGIETVSKTVALPTEYGTGKVRGDKKFDMFNFAGPDLDPGPGTPHNPQIRKLLANWASYGITTNIKSLDSMEKIKNYLGRFSTKFDLTDLEKLKDKKPGNRDRFIFEDGNYSIELDYYGEGEFSPVWFIFVFTPQDQWFEGLKVGERKEDVVKDYGEFNFEDKYGITGPWEVYINSDSQYLGIHFTNGLVDKFGLALNGYW